MEELQAQAAARGGVFTTADAAAAGVTPAHRKTLLANGDWVSLRRGVYAERGVADACRADPRRRHALLAAAAGAACGRSAYAASETAACLLDLDLFGPLPDRVTLLRSRASRSTHGTRDPSLRLLAATLPEQDESCMGGVPCTSLARTVADVARHRSLRTGVVVADAAMRRYGVGLDELQAVVARQQDWPGARRAARAFRLADPRSESALETLGRLSLADQQLPSPMSQVWLGDLRPEVRVDFYFAQFRTVGEADGRVKYVDASTLWEEKKRQDRLNDLGFQVVRFDYADVMTRPDELAARFRRAFARSATGPGRVFPDPDWWTAVRAEAWSHAARPRRGWWLRD